MYNLSQQLIASAPRVRETLNHEPAIRPNFSKAGLADIVVVIFCLMWNGMTDASAIQRYLQAQGCNFDRATIDFLLVSYEGNDPEHHLWSRQPLGNYQPMFEALSGGGSKLWDAA